MSICAKKRVLIFIVAYHAESTIVDVVRRIPATLLEEYDFELLIIDDSSQDQTFELSYKLSRETEAPFAIHVLYNPKNQGYGGNQKLGYRYAIEHGFDVVALLHGDGQYAPECLPDLLKPAASGAAAAVFGSRLLTPRGALKGGMPLYKYVGNRILTRIENYLLRTALSEFHSGYRVYTTDALRRIPFELNSNGFHFDTEIIIQLVIAKLAIVELPIPTYYGDEICRVNGIPYAVNVVKACLHARLQEWSLFYDRRYDCGQKTLSRYCPKFSFESTHSAALDLIPRNSKVLELGCATGYMGLALREKKQCRVTGVDKFSISEESFDEFYHRDLNGSLADVPIEANDYVLMLDVIEHLTSPEAFLENLRGRMGRAELIVSTGNVAFLATRIMLLAGQFNYGGRGILDLTHTRLFTFSSFSRLLDQSGFDIIETRAIPAPIPLALGGNMVSRTLMRLNSILGRLSPSIFGYQMVMRAKARPTVKSLLADAVQAAEAKAKPFAEMPLTR